MNKEFIYIDKDSRIPLIGSLYFGIIDKGSDMIEVRPITSCNINCSFCSVDEGINSKKQVNFIVEKDYLVDELKKLLEFKGYEGIQVYINPQGEPLLYEDIIGLVRDIAKIKYVKFVSIITNGVLLNKKKADDLIDAGLNRINLSINAFDVDKAKEIAGVGSYDVEKVKEIARYLSDKIEVIIAPVLLKNNNEYQVEKLIEFAKEISCKVLIQNFLFNKYGRNPCKPLSWKKFYSKLKEWEEKYDISLISRESSKSVKTKELPKPFKKGNRIKANIFCDGRSKKEKLAVSGERVVSVYNCDREGIVNVKITKAKHNIFSGVLV